MENDTNKCVGKSSACNINDVLNSIKKKRYLGSRLQVQFILNGDELFPSRKILFILILLRFQYYFFKIKATVFKIVKVQKITLSNIANSIKEQHFNYISSEYSYNYECFHSCYNL